MIETNWGKAAQLIYGKALKDYNQDDRRPVRVYGTNGPIGYTDISQNRGPRVIVGRKGAYRGIHLATAAFWVIDTAYYLDHSEEIYAQWAYYCLRNEDINGLGSGSAVPSTTKADFYALSLKLPSFSEQRAIAEVLGALDDKIAANEKIRHSTDELVSALFTKLQTGCKWGTLKDIAVINPAVSQPVAGGKLRYLDISAVSVGRYDFPPLTNWSDAPGRARRAVKTGDTVWSTVRPNRRSHALILDDEPDLVASTGLTVISPHKGRVACVYESTRTKRFTKYLESAAEGSAYPAIRADRFNDAPIPDLSTTNWDNFERFVLPLRKRVQTAIHENRELAKTRDELLPLLMSGKIRVKDAEKTVEEVV
jgi:type I restriction enzyme S subunit